MNNTLFSLYKLCYFSGKGRRFYYTVVKEKGSKISCKRCPFFKRCERHDVYKALKNI